MAAAFSSAMPTCQSGSLTFSTMHNLQSCCVILLHILFIVINFEVSKSKAPPQACLPQLLSFGGKTWVGAIIFNLGPHSGSLYKRTGLDWDPEISEFK